MYSGGAQGVIVWWLRLMANESRNIDRRYDIIVVLVTMVPVVLMSFLVLAFGWSAASMILLSEASVPLIVYLLIIRRLSGTFSWRWLLLAATFIPITVSLLVLTLGPDELDIGTRSMHGNSYVYKRRDLTDITSEEGVAYVHEHVGKYFKKGGIQIGDAHALRIAYAYSGTILSFSLSAENLRRFLRDKKPIPTPAKEVLSAIYSSGEFYSWQSSSYDSVQGYFAYLLEYPFDRLNWWPIADVDAEHMVGYVDSTTWRKGFWDPPSSYFVFADTTTGLVYLIGP
jgi:hypothetical protein